MKHYYLVNHEDLPTIFKEGIKPNDRFRHLVEDKHIFLTNEKAAPVWAMIFGTDTFLAVEAVNVFVIDGQETLYHAQTDTEIPPDKISVVSTPPCDVTMRELCLDSVKLMGYVCESVANYYVSPAEGLYDTEGLISLITYALAMSEHLDFAQVTEQDIRDAVCSSAANGHTTIFHCFRNTDARLWEKLVDYPEDEAAPAVRRLYDFIVENLNPGDFTITTGRWGDISPENAADDELVPVNPHDITHVDAPCILDDPGRCIDVPAVHVDISTGKTVNTVYKMSEAEIMAAYRYQERQFRLNDAKTHFEEYLECDGILAEEEAYESLDHSALHLPAPGDLDDFYESCRICFEDLFDANVAENDTWAMAIMETVKNWDK